MSKEILEGNKLLAEFMEATYWKAYNSKANHAYWATHFNSKIECQQAIDKQFNHPGLQYEAYKEEYKIIIPKLFWDGEYNSSWDWLMPVVEKIENNLQWKYSVEVGNNLYAVNEAKYYCMLHDAGSATCFQYESKDKIECVWLAVVEFIKWYNNQKQ